VPQSSANGTVVGTVHASAAGVGQSLTYVIAAGNTANTFQIDPATGVISVLDNTSLNANSPFNLTISVTDNNAAPHTSNANIKITVTSPNNAPQISNQTLSAVDGSPIGTVVGTVTATETDVGQTLTYAIIGGNTGGTFQI